MQRAIRYRSRILAALIIPMLLASATDASQSTSGLIVEEVLADSVAAKAGLKVGDRVLSYDDKPVPSPSALQALQENSFGKKAVVLRVRRGEETLTLMVPLGSLGMQIRPELPIGVLKLYEEGKAALQAKKASEAIARWLEAAKSAQEAGDRAAAAWLQGRVGQIHENQRQWKDAIAAHEAAWEILKESSDVAAQSRTLSGLGRCSESLNDFPTAAKWYEQARHLDETAGYEIWVAHDINGLGSVAYRRGDLQAAQGYCSQALAIQERLASDSLDVARSFSNLGRVAGDRGDLNEARDYYSRAPAIRERVAPDSLDVAVSLRRLGIVAYRRGDLNGAQGYYGRALAIEERLAPDSLNVAASLTNLGNVARARGDLNGAQGHLRQALGIQERLAPNSLDVAASLGNLGIVDCDRGDLSAAQDYHSRALAIQEKLAPNSLDVAGSLNNLGIVARDRGDLSAARDYHSRALAIKERLAPNSLTVAASLNNLGMVARDHGDLNAAQDYQSRALAIYERLAPNSLDVAGSLNNMGTVAHDRGDLNAAQDHQSRALTIQERLAPNSLDVAGSLNNLGLIAHDRGDIATAQDYCSRALAIYERLAPNSLHVAASLDMLGSVARNRGDLNGERDYHSRALAIRERLAPNSLAVAASLGNLGIVAYHHGDLSAAQDWYSRSLAIQERLAPNSLTVARSLKNLGNVAYNGGDLSAAQDYHSRALAIEERLAPGSLDVAGSLNNLGSVASNRGDLNGAEDYHSQALAIRERLAPDSLTVAASLNNLGNVAYARSDLNAAQDYYSRALAINERLAPGSLNIARNLNNLGYLALKERRFQDALPLFTRAVTIVETQCSKILSPEARALLLAQRTEPYTGLLRSSLSLNDLAAAFATFERARARSLVELLAERRLGFHADAPVDLLRKQDELDQNRSIDFAALMRADTKLTTAREELSKLDANKDMKQIEKLRERIEEFDRQMENLRGRLARYFVEQRELEAQIRRASPKVAALQYPEPLDLKGAQAALDSDTLLLAYYLDEDETYLFAVTKASLKLLTLPVGKKMLDEEVSIFQEQLARKRLGNPNERGQKLYDTLIRPAHELINQAKRILICPDGPLHMLPFAALVSLAKPTVRYFIDDKPLHTIVSMTVYAETRKQRAESAKHEKRVLALGDAIYTKEHAEEARVQRPAQVTQHSLEEMKEKVRGDAEIEQLRKQRARFGRLKYTRSEVETIGRLFGKSASVRLAEKATETTVRQESKRVGILHLAVHGWLDDRIGLNSALVLSQPELLGRSITKEDNGLLQAWEVFEHVKLNADLVVLSACETGLGTELKGEGLIGMTRAFQYAGAKSIVVSLWAVNDESTAVLMSSFYRELRKGASKDVALQRAMTVVRSNPRWRHPFYWSPFTLVGSWN